MIEHEGRRRAGGRVKTIYDPLPDGLYADVVAEHFTKPGYEQFWKYVKKFDLPALPYPRRINMLRRIDGTWYTEEQLQDRGVLARFGFNAREIDFIARQLGQRSLGLQLRALGVPAGPTREVLAEPVHCWALSTSTKRRYASWTRAVACRVCPGFSCASFCAANLRSS